MSFSVQDLVGHFEGKLKETTKDVVDFNVGMMPKMPMMVIYLGEETFQAHEYISSSLYEMWPPFQDELAFIGMRDNSGDREYVEFVTPQDTTALTLDNIRTKITSLFGLQSHFADKSKLLIYYVLDTTNLNTEGEFRKKLENVEVIRSELGIQSLSRLEMQCVLLNEDLVRREKAKIFRAVLSSYSYKKSEKPLCDSILLLSNLRDDGVMLENWSITYQMIAAVIALSNNSDGLITQKFFDNKVLTLGYAREEKPLYAIGMVVVNAMLRYLMENEKVTSIDYIDGAIRDKLGITSEGTLSQLDVFVEDHLRQKLPTPEQLEYFPRSDSFEHGNLSAMTAEEFNRLTLGAWSFFIQKLQNQIVADDATKKKWSDEYKKRIKREFTAAEQVKLKQGSVNFANCFRMRNVTTDGSLSVLKYAEKEMKSRLSRDEGIIEFFKSVLEEQGKEAEFYIRERSQLFGTIVSMFAVEEPTINEFYRKRLQNYLDAHTVNLIQEYQVTQNIEELKNFFYRRIEHIISSDSIFSLPFEEELAVRLSFMQNPAAIDAQQYIRDRLTDQNMRTYLKVNFALGFPMLSAVLLKTGTDLHHNFKANLPEHTYFYDTGSSEKAEAVVLYEVDKANLISG